MSPANVLRSLEYLDQCIHPLVKSTEGRGSLSRFLNEESYITYWKYYNEMTKFLVEFATETKNEEINRLSQQYIDNANKYEQYLKERSLNTGLFSFFSRTPVSEVEYYFKDQRDNITNLI